MEEKQYAVIAIKYFLNSGSFYSEKYFEVLVNSA